MFMTLAGRRTGPAAGGSRPGPRPEGRPAL